MKERRKKTCLLLPVIGVTTLSAVILLGTGMTLKKSVTTMATPINQNYPVTTASTTAEETTATTTTTKTVTTTTVTTTTVPATKTETFETASTTTALSTTTEEVEVLKIVEQAEENVLEPGLTKEGGTFSGPSGNETWYNLDMTNVVAAMQNNGHEYQYWIREDGVKMLGCYVMCAADLNIRPLGTIVETSLGKGIVCDTGDFTAIDPYQLDIAVNW